MLYDDSADNRLDSWAPRSAFGTDLALYQFSDAAADVQPLGWSRQFF